MSAPGPANLTTAKAVLAKVGLKEGDYTIDQLDMGQHVNAMKAGTFDAGYTLEPNASTMRKMGVARTLEAGVIAKYILGDADGNAYAGGLRVHHATSSTTVRMWPSASPRPGRRRSTSSTPTRARRASISPRTRSRPTTWSMPCRMLGYFMAKDMHRQAQGGVPEVHRLRDVQTGTCRRRSTSRSTSRSF